MAENTAFSVELCLNEYDLAIEKGFITGWRI